MTEIKKLFVVIIFICAAVTGVVMGTRWNHSESAPSETVNEGLPAANNPLPTADIPDLKAEYAMLITQDSGEVLYEKSAQNQAYPASTTKILTALLVIESCNMDELITVGKEVKMVASQSSTAGLQPGDRLTMRQLLGALMVPSGNDAAYTLAVYVARQKNAGQQLSDREALDYFSLMMNQRAQALGATDSHFTNPDGYHHSQQYTNARDLALIAREAMNYPAFLQAVDAADYKVQLTGRKLNWKNTNELVNPESPYYFSDATGIKTGHTTKAGYCLVSSGTRDRRSLIAVVLNSSKDGVFTDSATLLNYGFANYPVAQVSKQGIATNNSLIDYRSWRTYLGVLMLIGAYAGSRLLVHRKRQIRRTIGP